MVILDAVSIRDLQDSVHEAATGGARSEIPGAGTHLLVGREILVAEHTGNSQEVMCPDRHLRQCCHLLTPPACPSSSQAHAFNEQKCGLIRWPCSLGSRTPLSQGERPCVDKI